MTKSNQSRVMKTDVTMIMMIHVERRAELLGTYARSYTLSRAMG